MFKKLKRMIMKSIDTEIIIIIIKICRERQYEKDNKRETKSDSK